MMDEMTGQDWRDWQYFNLISPVGDWRNDLAASQIAATIANVNRGKDSQAFAGDYFIPDFGGAKAKAQEDYENSFEGMIAMFKKKS